MLYLMRIYKAASQPVRWQFWFTLGLVVANVAQRVSAQTTSTLAQELVTRDNFMLGVATVFAAGIVWTQFKDISKRLAEQEAETKRLRDEHLPETYVRRDVLEAQMTRITELLSSRVSNSRHQS